jgi:predicted RNA binding protein YcfA (HicA-like mRNA interferase family)
MPISGKQAIKILQENGFVVSRQRGSHVVLIKRHGSNKRITVVPLHKELKKGTIRGIAKLAGLESKDFWPIAFSSWTCIILSSTSITHECGLPLVARAVATPLRNLSKSYITSTTVETEHKTKFCLCFLLTVPQVRLLKSTAKNFAFLHGGSPKETFGLSEANDHVGKTPRFR